MSVEAVKRDSWCEYRSPELSSLVSREDVFLNIKVPFLILKENDLKPPVLLRLVVNGIIAGYHGDRCWDNRLTAIDWLENLKLFYRGICQIYWQKTEFKVISSLGVMFSVLHGLLLPEPAREPKRFEIVDFLPGFLISQGAALEDLPHPAAWKGWAWGLLLGVCGHGAGLPAPRSPGAQQNFGSFLVRGASPIQSFGKERGIWAGIFKSSCTVTYLTTDVIAGLMLCLKTYFDLLFKDGRNEITALGEYAPEHHVLIVESL